MGLEIGVREADELLLDGGGFSGDEHRADRGTHGGEREGEQEAQEMVAGKIHGPAAGGRQWRRQGRGVERVMAARREVAAWQNGRCGMR
jgi:hypothetical protein